MEEMDTQIVTRLNVLWRPVYEYLAQWMVQWRQRKTGWILELGPFSGGIISAMESLFPGPRTVCFMSQETVARAIKNQFNANFETVTGPLDALPFGASFDMVICRGAFFFLTPAIIGEAYRALKPGGYGLLGGGYGVLTPQDEIAMIAEESKQLNYRLGKIRTSKGELERMVKDAGMESFSEIIEEGGLWLLLKKV